MCDGIHDVAGGSTSGRPTYAGRTSGHPSSGGQTSGDTNNSYLYYLREKVLFIEGDVNSTYSFNVSKSPCGHPHERISCQSHSVHVVRVTQYEH